MPQIVYCLHIVGAYDLKFLPTHNSLRISKASGNCHYCLIVIIPTHFCYNKKDPPTLSSWSSGRVCRCRIQSGNSYTFRFLYYFTAGRGNCSTLICSRPVKSLVLLPLSTGRRQKREGGREGKRWRTRTCWSCTVVRTNCAIW